MIRAVPQPAPRRALAVVVASALCASLAACGGGTGGTTAGKVGTGAGARPAKRAEATCIRAMSERGLIDFTDLTPTFERQLARAMPQVARAVTRLRELHGNGVAAQLAADLARTHRLGVSYLRVAQGQDLAGAADRFQQLKQWVAQLQSHAALSHAPSCSLHALVD